ncbi:MAG: hypothetical protein QGG42_03920 [Phycisphaerae bacterium]|nr:hypothetical protein [Phycisphaerae bacterium]
MTAKRRSNRPVVTAMRNAHSQNSSTPGRFIIEGDRLRAAYRCKMNVKKTRNADRTVTRTWDGQ